VTPPDTIVAIASPAGRGAVGVIRVSGADVPRIAADVLGAMPQPRMARLARFLDPTGGTLDQGLALYFPAPASYTGEHVLEFQGHGGVLVMDLLVERLLSLGCRMARPGEFSERAFLNGKMDVAQAEAVADLIDAGTATAARAAVRSMQGEFSKLIQALQAQLTELRAYVEAAIDFPDEAIDFLSSSALRGRLARVFAAFDSIKSAARHGALLRDGLTVVIAGKPNAGKSSVLNRLVGEDVAIVTDVPGTTRDLLRQHLHLDGLPLNLIDTAGLRTAADVVEEEGIRRAKAEIRRADRVLYVVDGSLEDHGTSAAEIAALPVELAALSADRVSEPGGRAPEGHANSAPDIPVTVLVNKIDLSGVAARLDETEPVTIIFVSARTGEGMDLVRAHLKATVGYRDAESGALSARRRHLDALRRADLLVRGAAAVLASTQAVELFAEDLRLAQRALGEITGEFTSDDLLGEIFGSFCIGK
jgi:tRNA modification GTPase